MFLRDGISEERKIVLLECRKHINYSETLQFQAIDFQLKTLYLAFLTTPLFIRSKTSQNVCFIGTPFL